MTPALQTSENYSLLRIPPEEFSACREEYTHCALCPRRCGVDRTAGQTGFCGCNDTVLAARAALHPWEEPCLTGAHGAGTVFFSGCTLRCLYCQNADIAAAKTAWPVTPLRLAEIFLELQEKGAACIDLVTPTHFAPTIRLALRAAKRAGLTLPVVSNTSGYETAEAVRAWEGLIDIWMPDLKYVSEKLSAEYSSAPDYFAEASLALREMVRQTGDPVFSDDGLLLRGVLVRHLLLPRAAADSRRVLTWLWETFGGHILLSFMNQYTPMPAVSDHPILSRRPSPQTYERLADYAASLGFENGYFQEGEAAKESFIPVWNGEGL